MRSRELENLLKGFLIGLTVVSLISLLCSYVAISPTSSDLYRVFLKVPCRGYRKGTYVAFIPPAGAVYAPPGVRFIKQICCVPGDIIIRKGRSFYCNGKFIGYALKRTRRGQPLSPWNIKENIPFRIPEGFFFVKGKNPRSYDSRYYGLISVKEITACYKPLF